MIPATIYNVNQYNKTFTFDEGAGPIAATLTEGNYDVTNFGTMLSGIMTGLSGAGRTYSATISNTTKKLTVTNDLNGNTAVSFPGAYSQQAMQLWGMSANYPSGNPISGGEIVDLSSPSSIGIRIKESTSWGLLNGTTGIPATMYVPMNRTFGSYVSIPYDDLPQEVTFANPTGQLSIELVDLSTGTSLSLGGGEWEMLLTK